jgi:hypothetical protein
MADIKVKAGVDRSAVIIAAVANEARRLPAGAPKDVVVTSVNDGTHMPGSKHYTDEAVDVRSKNFPNRETKDIFVQRVLTRLGSDYQGFIEAEGTANEHFHFEYDPS